MSTLKRRRHQIKNLTVQLKKLGKEQTKSKASRRMGIIQITEQINEIENRKTIINEISYFFENINKIDNSLARLSKKKGIKIEIPKIRNELGSIISIFYK